jgi:hypothetical protein
MATEEMLSKEEVHKSKDPAGAKRLSELRSKARPLTGKGIGEVDLSPGEQRQLERLEQEEDRFYNEYMTQIPGTGGYFEQDDTLVGQLTTPADATGEDVVQAGQGLGGIDAEITQAANNSDFTVEEIQAYLELVGSLRERAKTPTFRGNLSELELSQVEMLEKQLDSDNLLTRVGAAETLDAILAAAPTTRRQLILNAATALNTKWETDNLGERFDRLTKAEQQPWLEDQARRLLEAQGISNPTPSEIKQVSKGLESPLSLRESYAKGAIDATANAVAQGFATVADAEAFFDSVLAVQDTLDDGKGGFIDIGFNTEQLVRGLATGYSQGRLKLTDALDYLNDINTVAGQRMQEQRLSRQQRFLARQEEQRIRESRETEFARLAEKPTEEMRQYLNTLGVLGPRLPPVGTGRRIGGADIYQRMQEQRGFEPAQFREIGVENIPVPPITSAIADAAQRIAAAYPETTARKLLS